MSTQKPLATVAMITYGHEAYIKQSIEGVLMQECDFEVELIISNDCSPDKTDKVINDIIANHPRAHWIKYVKHKQNKGVAKNFAWVLQEGSGKYIALCEGDDYWTDPLKLQKQVGFLEKHCDFSMACNSSSEIDENGKEYKIANRKEEIIHLAMVLKEGWFIRTASIVFRKEAIKEGFPDFFFKAYSTDYILQVMLLKTGLCKYFPEVMSAYRHHQGGISQANNKLQVLRWITKIQLLEVLNDFTERKFNKEVNHHQRRIARTISFYLYRYPKLVNAIGLKNYFKHGNLALFFQELSKRLIMRFKNKMTKICFYATYSI
jgi:glycosyltransferase involved in cell wall biosynthesis